jgi:alkylation response protein AidB-like acyl-CoA dehydrogenase
LEFARPLVYRAAWSVARGDDARSQHVGMAKARASEAALLAGRIALQVHGAIGYTTEYDLHLWLKRAWALAASWGDAAGHLDRLGSAILDTDTTPEEQ